MDLSNYSGPLFGANGNVEKPARMVGEAMEYGSLTFRAVGGDIICTDANDPDKPVTINLREWKARMRVFALSAVVKSQQSSSVEPHRKALLVRDAALHRSIVECGSRIAAIAHDQGSWTTPGVLEHYGKHAPRSRSFSVPATVLPD